MILESTLTFFPSHTCHHNPPTHTANTNGFISIVLNAGSTPLSASGAGFFVNPVRANLVGTGPANLFYDVNTKEISVVPSPSAGLRDLKETGTAYFSRRRDLTDIQEVKTTESAHVWDLRPVSYRAIHEANDGNAPVYYALLPKRWQR
jgi:hypothetical protein